jgi:antitoxin VapB
MQKAKLFWSGRSQAVRLPKEFRFDGDEVRVRRHGNAVILEPIADDWAWLREIQGKLPDEVLDAAGEQSSAEEREGLDELFSR